MSVNVLKTVNTRDAKRNFTKLNRTVSEKGDMTIITRRGKPVTALISMDKLKKLMGEKKFKELLYEFYTVSALENEIRDVFNGKEKILSGKDVKKELGW